MIKAPSIIYTKFQIWILDVGGGFRGKGPSSEKWGAFENNDADGKRW
jgi:hypothetical protein